MKSLIISLVLTSAPALACQQEAQFAHWKLVKSRKINFKIQPAR